MSNGPKTITQLPAATAYAASDLIPIVQNISSSNTTRSITPALLLAAYANLSAPSFTNTVTIANTLSVTNSVSTNNFVAANTLTAGNSTVNAVIGYSTFQSYGAVAAFAGNQNNYVEMYLYNANSQSNASSDMIVFDNNGPLGNNFVDMGIVSTTWASAGWTISKPSDAYLYSANTNLSIGVQSIGGGSNYINFFTGGSLAANERMKIDAGGNVNIGNTTGTTSLTVGTSTTNTVINSISITATTYYGNAASGPAYAQSLGYMGLPQNIKSTSYTIQLSDYGGHILSQTSGAGTQTITLANNSNAAIPIGGSVTIILQGTGSLIIAPDTGATLYLAGSSSTSNRTLASYGMATALKIGTNIWMISGTGLT
jgi:hypothetical protein